MKHRDEFGDSNGEIGCSFFMLFRMGGGRIPSVGFLEGWNKCESTDKTKQRINPVHIEISLFYFVLLQILTQCTYTNIAILHK